MYKISKKIRTVKAPLAYSKFCSKGLKRPLLSLRGITHLSTAHPFGSAHLFGGVTGGSKVKKNTAQNPRVHSGAHHLGRSLPPRR